jgi:RimJ/RimL family protein N-acetyltransferase
MPKRLTAKQVAIQFNLEDSKLSITIITPRLYIRSVTIEDIDRYFQLFSDKDVMAKYATGNPLTDLAVIRQRLAGWVERFAQNDPFNGLAVFDKKTKKFIGHIVLGRSEEGRGVSELAYLFHKEFWYKGIGTEAVSAVVNHYAPQIFKKKYKLDGHEFTKITATTRTNHTFSKKILETVGLTTNNQVNYKFGAQRYIYNVIVSDLLYQNTLGQTEIIKYGVNALVTGLGLFVAYKIFSSAPSASLVQSKQFKF